MSFDLVFFNIDQIYQYKKHGVWGDIGAYVYWDMSVSQKSCVLCIVISILKFNLVFDKYCQYYNKRI